MSPRVFFGKFGWPFNPFFFAGLLAFGCRVTSSQAQTTHAATNLSIGLCTTNLVVAKALGFDFAEIGVRDFVAMSDADFASYVTHCRSSGLAASRGYLFLPGDLKVVGPKVHTNEVVTYFQKALRRSEQLGITMIAWGSGDSRKVPDGFSQTEAFQQLVYFAKLLAPAAREHGIVVLAEPLRRAECNIINSAREGLAWVEAVNDPNFQLLVDIFHMQAEKEDCAIIIKAGAHIRHIHFSNPIGRRYPARSDVFDYQPFFNALRQINYHDALSIEAGTSGLAQDGPEALAMVRAAYHAIGN